MPADKLLCHTIQRFYGGKQYSLQGASGTASGAAEYTNAYRSSDSILVVHCGTLQFVPGTSTGCSTIFAQKGIPKMEQLSARLLLTAGILLLIAGGIFAILQGWLYTGLLWAGAFGCLMAALNFWDSKNDGG